MAKCDRCNDTGKVRHEGMLCTDGKRRATLHKCKCKYPKSEDQITIDSLTSALAAANERAERWKAEAMAWRVSAAWNVNMMPVDANWHFQYGNEVLRTRFINDTAEPPATGASPSDPPAQQESKP